MAPQSREELKTKLRDEIKSKIGEMSDEWKKKQSSKIFKLLVKEEKLISASRVFVYLSTDYEVNTIPILRHLFEKEKQVYVPMIPKRSKLPQHVPPHMVESRMIMVRLKSMEQYEKLEVNHYGIKEFKIDEVNWSEDVATPSEMPESSYELMARQSEDSNNNNVVENDDEEDFGCDEVRDLFLVPGVAFTREGHRLGHGMGYYDEFLYNWSSHLYADFWTIGLAFREQIVPKTYHKPQRDYALHEIFVYDPLREFQYDRRKSTQGSRQSYSADRPLTSHEI